MKKQFGFTLIELLITMGIMAVLATLATTSYLGYRDRVIIDREGTKAVEYLREGIGRARSQQVAGNSTSTVWAIHIDTGASDYYELLSGGATGTSVDRAYLRTGVTFTATTSNATQALHGGSTLEPLDTSIIFGLIVTGTSIREEIVIEPSGKITRTKYY